MEKQFNISKEQYQTVLNTWKQKKEHSAAEHIIYNALRSKPSACGFSIKSKNIQGNDPWFGFNHSLKAAQSLCSLVNPWEAYKGAEFGNSSYERGLTRINVTKVNFKNTFGIDLTPEIFNMLGDKQ